MSETGEKEIGKSYRLFVTFSHIERAIHKQLPEGYDSDATMCWACWENPSDVILVGINNETTDEGICRKCLERMIGLTCTWCLFATCQKASKNCGHDEYPVTLDKLSLKEAEEQFPDVSFCQDWEEA